MIFQNKLHSIAFYCRSFQGLPNVIQGEEEPMNVTSEKLRSEKTPMDRRDPQIEEMPIIATAGIANTGGEESS